MPGRQKAKWVDDIVKFTGNKLFHRVAANRVEWARVRKTFAQNQDFVRFGEHTMQ